MKNSQWITRILNKIKYRQYKLSIPIKIDDDIYTFIKYIPDEPNGSPYIWTLANDNWEISVFSVVCFFPVLM